ncbi:MAG: hypothetical protein HQK53_14780, partial [Oligoflexia bacterium]|nr:hypothetical protein [Oligoflexia bacterium]
MNNTSLYWYKEAIIYQLHVRSFYDSNKIITRTNISATIKIPMTTDANDSRARSFSSRHRATT